MYFYGKKNGSQIQIKIKFKMIKKLIFHFMQMIKIIKPDIQAIFKQAFRWPMTQLKKMKEF